MKHLHFIGICGTFMGNLALLARELGFKVTGSDFNSYPPMSDMLQRQGITCANGYRAENLTPKPDMVLVGNTISRTNPEVDATLNGRIKYNSGPQWLYENILHERKVVTVAGTHGKTTTSSMIAWIFQFAGLQPGYLIGGVAQNFANSSQVGAGEWFVVEGDEYDTAYFDKRSKFIHYRPFLATCLNLEFDHADIFQSIEDIERQFQYFVRTLPSSGKLIANLDDPRIQKIVTLSPWANSVSFSVSGDSAADWRINAPSSDYKEFEIHSNSHGSGTLHWQIPGRHNAENALAAVATAACAGVPIDTSIKALQEFIPVRRRLEFLGEFDSVRIYDDFAHHPTAIRTSIAAIRNSERPRRLVAIFEPRSNTMRMGIHGDKLVEAFDDADLVYMYRGPGVKWEPDAGRSSFACHDSTTSLLDSLSAELDHGDCVLIMSNGGFDNLQSRLMNALAQRETYSSRYHSEQK